MNKHTSEYKMVLPELIIDRIDETQVICKNMFLRKLLHDPKSANCNAQTKRNYGQHF